MIEIIFMPVMIIILGVIQSDLSKRKFGKWILPSIIFIISTCLTFILVKSELTSYANKGKKLWEIFSLGDIVSFIMVFIIFNIPTIVFLMINKRMKLFKSLNTIITMLNVIYFIAINVIYFELPVPNRYYLRDLEPAILNLSIIGFSVSILLWLIYLYKFKKNRKERELSLYIILIEVMIVIWSILYKV